MTPSFVPWTCLGCSVVVVSEGPQAGGDPLGLSRLIKLDRVSFVRELLWLFRRQKTRELAEILLAGILLGPSCFHWDNRHNGDNKGECPWEV